MLLSIFVTLNFFNVNASADSLHSLNKNEPYTTTPPKAFAIRNGNIQQMSKHKLKQAQHCLRMKLNNQNRSPSLAPPLGQYRQSLEDQLTLIDNALSRKQPC